METKERPQNNAIFQVQSNFAGRAWNEMLDEAARILSLAAFTAFSWNLCSRVVCNYALHYFIHIIRQRCLRYAINRTFKFYRRSIFTVRSWNFMNLTFSLSSISLVWAIKEIYDTKTDLSAFVLPRHSRRDLFGHNFKAAATSDTINLDAVDSAV